jgi:AraC-like DNA-binding protein
MKASSLRLSWPLRYLPKVAARQAGEFPMIAPGCNHRSYRHRTVALHLHDYAGEMWIGKRRFPLRPGDITFSPSSTTTRYDLAAGGSHLCIHFYPPTVAPRNGTVRLPLHFRIGPRIVAARERFWRVIDHARQSGDNPDAPAGCAASASLQELVLWLYLQSRRTTTSRRGSLAEEALAKLSQAIDTSLAKPMSIGELAAGVGLSAEYVARLFAERHGMTLQHYLLLRRMEIARHLLVSSDLLISEIGREVGIPDPQYFNKQFRRMAGQSPLVYRRLQASPSNRRGR